MKALKKNCIGLALFLFILAGIEVSALETSSINPSNREVTVGLNDVYVPGGFDPSMDAFVVVSGMFPNSCYKWRGAYVKNFGTYAHEITSRATVSQGICLMVLIPFTKDIHLGRLNSGIHQLRFMNGDGTYFLKTMKIE